MNEPQVPVIPAPESASELNEEADLRLETARAKYDARMEELDRKDRAGPHWIHRG